MFIFLVVRSFVMLVFLVCIFVFNFVYSVLLYCFVCMFLLLCKDITFLFLYKFTEHCHRLETQIQYYYYILYITVLYRIKYICSKYTILAETTFSARAGEIVFHRIYLIEMSFTELCLFLYKIL
jgi:hypothetical protein